MGLAIYAKYLTTLKFELTLSVLKHHLSSRPSNIAAPHAFVDEFGSIPPAKWLCISLFLPVVVRILFVIFSAWSLAVSTVEKTLLFVTTSVQQLKLKPEFESSRSLLQVLPPESKCCYTMSLL